MIATLFNSLFSQRDAIGQAKQETDLAVIQSKLVAATMLNHKPDDIQSRIDTVRELDQIIADYTGAIDHTWRCYVSGYQCAVFKDGQSSKITVNKI